MNQIIQVKVIVKGRVQGVFYRASTQKMAQSLSIKGWVKNMPNGDVAAVFKGDKNQVDQMIQWCKKGPGASRVDQVLCEPQDETIDFQTFDVRY